jgi:hypothetical protein
MCVTDIPHFKEIIIMSFLCDECGNRTVEVKGGGAVPDHGTKTTLRVEPGEETLGWGLGWWGKGRYLVDVYAIGANASPVPQHCARSHDATQGSTSRWT